MKCCSKCKEKFPITPEFFCIDKRNKDGLGALCITCNRKRTRDQIRKYREQHPEAGALYYAENRDSERERIAQWAADHPDKVKEKVKRWSINNRDKRRANETRRRAQKSNSEGTHTADDIERQYKSQKGNCYYCGVKVGKKYHVDHIVPLGRGGSNGPENLVIACPFCNVSKSDKLPHEWAQGGRLL
jgi:5-methylcytosine-specific restriction endonuclease McrA